MSKGIWKRLNILRARGDYKLDSIMRIIAEIQDILP